MHVRLWESTIANIGNVGSPNLPSKVLGFWDPVAGIWQYWLDFEHRHRNPVTQIPMNWLESNNTGKISASLPETGKSYRNPANWPESGILAEFWPVHWKLARVAKIQWPSPNSCNPDFSDSTSSPEFGQSSQNPMLDFGN